jgi:uncharacterized membrane protein
MTLNRAHAVSLTLVVAAFALAAARYSHLPDAIPTHWNAQGEVNGTTAKPWGPFVMPLMMAATYALLAVTPRISPQGYRMERFRGAFETVQVALLGFLFALSALVVLQLPLAMHRLSEGGTGVLLIVIGNVMGKITKNFFFGIRTPWTLANDEVWLRTHRLGGKLFVAAGLGVLITAACGVSGSAPLLIGVGAAALIPSAYSFLLYRRLEGFKNAPH